MVECIYTNNFFRLVVEKLKEVDGERKCFRLVGGILVERTVSEVLPALVSNKEKVSEDYVLYNYIRHTVLYTPMPISTGFSPGHFRWGSEFIFLTPHLFPLMGGQPTISQKLPSARNRTENL